MSTFAERLRSWLGVEAAEEAEPSARTGQVTGDPLAPRRLDEFVGQEEAVRLLQTEVAAAKREGRLLSHILFYGPPGLGKSALAFALAEEMGGLPIYESTGAEFVSQKEMVATIARVGELQSRTGRPAIFLLDEVDGMARTASYPLHSFFTHGYFQWEGRRYQDACGGPTIIATTNHMARVHRALKSRFQEVVLVDYYSPAELAEIARRSASRLGFVLGEGVAEWIGENSGGEPRKTNRRILRGVANLLVGGKTATLELTKEALRLSGLRAKGLSRAQVGYLQFLATCDDGTAGVNSIASFLGQDVEDVRGEEEPFLIRDSYVRVTRGGRKLTEKGQDYLKEQSGGIADR